jgi:hypothetical protein
MLKLGDNWKETLRYAWSVRFMLLAAVLSGAEAIMPFLNLPKWAVFSLVAASLVARVVVQKDLK